MDARKIPVYHHFITRINEASKPPLVETRRQLLRYLSLLVHSRNNAASSVSQDLPLDLSLKSQQRARAREQLVSQVPKLDVRVLLARNAPRPQPSTDSRALRPIPPPVPVRQWRKRKFPLQSSPGCSDQWVPFSPRDSNCFSKPDENWHCVNNVSACVASPLKFPWVSVNPLNRIFLQESQPQADAPTKTEDQTGVNDAEASSSVSADSTPSPSCPASSGPNIKKSYAESSKSWVPTEKSDTSKSILAPSKLGTQSKLLLKPSTLGTHRLGGTTFTLPTVTVSSTPVEPKPAFKLKPSVLKNPFSTVAPPKEDVDSTSPSKEASPDSDQPHSKRLCTRGEAASSSEQSVASSIEATPDQDKSGSNVSSSSEIERQTPVSSVETPTELPTSSGPASIPAFVPLNTDATSQDEGSSKLNGVSTTSSLSPGGFIFGQNISNRVIGVSSSTSAFTNGELASSEGNLFTEAATSIVPSSNNVAAAEGGKTLSESSRELSEKEESLKRKYEEVAVVTGEENEKNVLQMHCKLYGWVNGCWQERGRGNLRLNDREVRDELHSRLVIRTQGTLTVMLNAKVWAEMSIEKSNDKSVRFTATGADGQAKIYLVMGSPKDITLLYNSLEYRLGAARSQSIDEKERKDMDVQSST